MKHEELNTRPKHLHDQADPTVMHHPEEDQTLLYRWFKEQFSQGPGFWIPFGLGLVALVGGLIALRLWMSAESKPAKTWSDLILARYDTAQLVKIGDEGIGPAASWAYLRTAQIRYDEGFRSLPQDRDKGLAALDLALEFFKKAESKSEPGSFERQQAAMGIARTLETRGERLKAIEQYQQVAKTWPESPLGKKSSELAKRLESPESQAFYTEFGSFKPTTVQLPASGRSVGGLPPLLPAERPALDPTLTAPLLLDQPASPGSPSGMGDAGATLGPIVTPPAPAPEEKAAEPKAEPAAAKADAPTPP